MAMDNLKKISSLNDELDIKLFLYIAKKNILFPVAFVIFALLGSYLYLRYTQPVYQTSAILQLNTENQASRILPTASLYDDDIAKQIELLRSSVFLKRSLSKLPLEISYFTKGTVLNNELYRNSPFQAEVKVKNPRIYGIPIYVDFPAEGKVLLTYTINGNPQQKIEQNLGTSISSADFDLEMEVLNYRAIAEQQSIFSRNSYFFIINNPDHIASKYAPSIKINVLNAAAKTILVSSTGTNAQKASDIANTIVEEFTIYDLEKKAESANNILVFIDKQLDLVFDKLTESELELDDFKRKNKIDDTALKPFSSIQGLIGEFEAQIINLQLERNIFDEIEYSLTREHDIDIYMLISILAGSEFHGSISGQLRALQELLLERERLLYQVTPTSRQIEAINYKIAIQKRIITESITTLKNNLEKRSKDLEARIESYERLQRDRISSYNIIEFSRLQRIHGINERFYNQLVEKKAEYSISKAGYVSQSTILQRSSTPGKAIWPISRNIYISGLLAAIFLGFGIILLQYLFYNQIPSLHDILKYTHVPVLGVIPKYKSEIPANHLLVQKKPKSLISESLRSIRTNLQFIDNEPGSKLVAVTSTVSGEGKTFFAMNLAGILAFSNKKAIVIDLDMRKPKIHLGFDVENRKGVSTILSGIDQVSDCIRSSKVDNLDFITAGPVPPNPSELILTPRMDQMIEYLKSVYDYVIIDNPPVGIVTDGMKSIMMADYPVYLFKANYSRRIFIQNVNRLFSESSIRKLSIVLNAVDAEYSSYGYDKGYAYGYYGGYGYGYYEEESIGSNGVLHYLKNGRKKLLK
jgi:tyrosine-protein kinase Etk/Wzc